MDVKSKIRTFVLTNFYVAEPDALSDSASLLDGGIIDSTGVLEVIGFLEDNFAITVEDQEMIPDNLDSIERLCNFVVRKQT